MRRTKAVVWCGHGISAPGQHWERPRPIGSWTTEMQKEQIAESDMRQLTDLVS